MRKFKSTVRDISESYSAKAIIGETMIASFIIASIIFMFFDVKQKMISDKNKKPSAEDLFYDFYPPYLLTLVCGFFISAYRIYKNLYRDINATQKNIIESFINPFLDDLDQLSLDNAIKTIEIIMNAKNADAIYQQSLLSPEIRALASQISHILVHPCPQNRTTSCHPSLEKGNFIAFKDVDGNICYEQRGLLSLTAYNDLTANPISREATVAYIKDLMIKKQKQLIAVSKQNHIEQMHQVNRMNRGR